MTHSPFPDFITDIHTHRRDAGPGAIININPDEEMRPGCHYSVGIHPWDTGDADNNRWEKVKRQAMSPQVLAIGETGIDTLHRPQVDIDTQLAWLRRHIALSESAGKPLILHVVKGLQHILALKKELKPRQPWIWHGFRGKPQMARQLVDAGIYLSLGDRFNPEVAEAVDPRFLLHETD